MNIVGVIVFMFALGSAVGYHHIKRKPIRYYLLELAFLLIAITASCLYMLKCYEVPIHNNHISYVLKHHPAYNIHYTGNTSIDIVYDYNTYKGVKELTKWGAPKDTEPLIVVENYIKVDSGKSSIKQEYGYLDNEMKWLEKGRQMLLEDPIYVSYMDSCGLEKGSKNWIEGTFFIVSIACSNRQFFYPFIFSTTNVVSSSWRNEFAYPTHVGMPDSVWREFQWERIVPTKRSANNAGLVSYNFIPSSDSIIYHGTVFRRSDFRRPSAIFTAEDISRAVEVLWIDGLRRNESEINISSLSFDYIGPAEFSDMYPEPDRREVSKIVFTDSTKLSHIVENGLRFHVKFPDMENIQQMRMFVVTLVLGGLLGLFASLIYKIICLYWGVISDFLKRRCYLNRRKGLWFCTLLLVVYIIILILVAMNSYVDAFDLNERDSMWVF